MLSNGQCLKQSNKLTRPDCPISSIKNPLKAIHKILILAHKIKPEPIHNLTILPNIILDNIIVQFLTIQPYLLTHLDPNFVSIINFTL